MAYKQVRDDKGRLVCEYDGDSDTVRVKQRVDGKKEFLEAQLNTNRDKRGNITDSNK